ncbi:hypothetical protein PUNSTDRAFT_39704, partial [Punctularia strigosozonata HHB-11173 SS5]|uniref:uncharacterized protein n=1 Tax=Punctularia strigosozonata (strain HHB-11173) TaxID=741275 RepID=UPI0004416C62
VFSLCVDFFNVEGMNIRGARTSCGIIALACLNLPIEIRYKPQNMYLAGIILGPKEPARTATNHYIRPLIDDMLKAWHPGIYISRTALRPHGRLTHSAIVVGVCDLPAARKTSALAPSISKIFCSTCTCWNVTDDDGNIIRGWRDLLRRTDHLSWSRRDGQEMRWHAEQWRNATSSREQDEIFKRHGVRWSELWRLPYWDPTRQLVVDPMHCLYEGLAKFHFCTVLALSESNATVAPKSQPAFVFPFALPPIEDEECDVGDDASTDVMDVDDLTSTSQDGPQIGDQLAVEYPAEVSDVGWTPKQETTKPSWVEGIPEDFGAAAAGTPKAAEWRTLFRLYLPLALVSLLSQSTSPHFMATVDNTMELVLALIVGCRGTTSRRRADSYRNHLRSYIEGLKTLYPNLQLNSIHHLAFHIHDFLTLFGPVPSWWCFPYERLIGKLQRTNHNHIFRELEATIHRTFVYSG